MWFILSLVAVFFWSGSDFFSKLGSPEEEMKVMLEKFKSYGQRKGEDK